ncbi:MAG: EamA family transporter [Candidatus Saccharibacteria bacterium]
MTWQLIITLQIIVSSLMAMFTRHITLSNRHVFIGVGVASYSAVALSGIIFSIISNNGFPTAPSAIAWTYIFFEGLCIPAAWLIQYKLVSHLGAGNAVTISTLNMLSAALLGVLFLNEAISLSFVFGAMFIITGTFITLRIRPDITHHNRPPFILMISLVIAGMILFAVGMYFEKTAINIIGVWNYSAYGWGMQLIVIIILFILFGRKELPHIKPKIIKNGLILGFMTSLAGGLYIYALSLGSLSHTIIAASGKVAITVLLAAIFLKERNNILLRATAFLLSVIGLSLVVY